ncbi:MAG: TraB/GumN family protein [Gammaproteobacteria bacterium]|nr:TraB/GumN family protein [Gammaproteobacteria bacterium]
MPRGTRAACAWALLVSVCLLAPPALARDESLFWKVESGTAVVYLLGSIHVGTPELYPFPEVVEQAFAASDRLVLEVDVTELDQAQVGALTLRLGLATDGTTLQALLPAELYAAAEAEMRRLGLAMAPFQVMKPWLFALTLMQLGTERQGFAAEQGVDLHFARRATGKQVLGLETIDEQLGLFDNLTTAQQILLLQNYLHDLRRTREGIEQLVAAYRRLDAAWIRDFLFESLQEDPANAALYDIVLDQRNLRMAAKLDSMLRGEDTHFVVVGAAHLFGDQGLVALLRQRGYEATDGLE